MQPLRQLWCTAALAALAAAPLAAQREVPYADAWDPAAQAAAEAAVARLGAKRALNILPIVRVISGMAPEVGGGGTGIVGTVTGVQQAMRDLGATETALEVRMELPADVLFDFDKADIKKEAEPSLTKVATVMKAYPRSDVQVEGHTDAKGSASYNQRLSERRAGAVRSWLAAQEGLKEVRFAVRGFGATKPVAPNQKPDGSDDPEGRQKNRRVEIVVRKG